jgi:single-stranded-DNA-specific exonuclease
VNRERQELTRQVQEQARVLALAAGEDAPLLFAASPDFPVGILGLAAGRLSEEFYRPAIVVGVDGEFAKGSARSIPEFHITKALDDAAELLVRHGGHAAAAGFTVRAENLDRLRERLLALAQEQLAGIVLEPTLHVDIETPLGALSWEVYEALAKLSPFGCGNQVPVFASRHVRVLDARAVGAEGRHLKLCVAAEDGRRWDAIAFRQGEQLGQVGAHVDLAYNLDRNDWKGHTSLQLKVLDIH